MSAVYMAVPFPTKKYNSPQLCSIQQYMRRKNILQYVTQTQVSVIIEDAYFSPFQGPII